MQYYILHPRRFANEYEIGIATTAADAAQYEEEGFRRTTRDEALRDLSYRPHGSHQLFRSVTVDGHSTEYSSCEIARALRTGRTESVGLPRHAGGFTPDPVNP